MKFTLPIKSTYVPDWGLWECLRELVQNAKDEEEQHHHAMTVTWADGLLTLHNEGADMDRKALLIGHSGKTGADLRGKFGEGLDLALLAGVRAGKKLVIETRTERWTPSVGYSAEFGANCLAVSTRARRAAGSGVTVTVELTEDEWLAYKPRFLFLSNLSDTDMVRVPEKGAILLQGARKGHVYVRGIYVDCLPKLECGYDLNHMSLDRDRRMINVWDLQYTLGEMYREAVSRRPELLGRKLYGMLRDGAEDIHGFRYHASKGDAVDAVVASFREEHGEDAVPVASIAEAREMEHIGKRGVVVSEPLREAVKSELDADKVRASVKNEILRSIPWADLSFEEKAILTQYTTMIDQLAVLSKPVAQSLDIIELRDKRIAGIHFPDGRIGLARWVLDQPSELLTTLIHEVAHNITSAGDGTHDHISAIERIWSKLFFSRTAS